MQPPPQAASAGANGPPPLSMSRNTYWRNGPFGRRANVPVSVAAGPVQPVTDPFAFGRQAPRGPSLINAPRNDAPVMQSFSPMAFPPSTVTQAPHPHNGDNFSGPLPSLTTPVSQPGSHGPFPNTAAPLPLFPMHVANSAEVHSGAERGAHGSLGQAHSVGTALENSVGGQQGSGSVPDRPPSGQEISQTSSNPISAPTPLSYYPTAQQMVPPHWKPPQSGVQTQGHVYPPNPELPPPNIFYTVPQASASLSQPGPGVDSHQSSAQQLPAVQSATQAPLTVGDVSSMAAPPGANHSGTWQNTGGAGSWPGQFPQEHFYLQPLEMSYPASNSSTQGNHPSAQHQGAPEAASRQCKAEADPGTVSMFFKGDEAENEEILSSEKGDRGGKEDADTFQQMTGDTYYQPLHPHQMTVGPLSPAQAEGPSDVQHPLRSSYQQPEFLAGKHPAVVGEDKVPLAEAPAVHAGSQYENVENLECVQNQEVLPREPPLQSCSSPGAIPDPNRYASLAGVSLPKSHMEVGPNLEAPDLLPRPIRTDSVSSSYSNLSLRSASSSSRPQELGTFIQQESGKAEEDSYSGFFKQIDSSPLVADKHNPGKTYHSGLSQAPTPSPPKPTGVFQTSANSSFEPVRSHSLGVKPAEADQAKMVAELRESRPNQRSTEKSPAVPVASPGNLEQPPDNLETFFAFQARPGPPVGPGTAGNLLQSVSRSTVENLQAAPERKNSARAQVSVKKCESPATTLWAQNELPDFGGNVLLAPAAPAVYVQAKQPVQVVQPAEEPGKGRSAPFPPTQAGNVSSENLENPPKMGEEEEALGSQGSSGYASLLSSPPTEALQNQPILIVQPDQSYGGLVQPVNFSLAHQPSKQEGAHLATDPAISGQFAGNSADESASSSAMPPGGPLLNSGFLQNPLGAPEMPPSKPGGRLPPPASHTPLNLALENQKTAGVEGLPPELVSKPRTNAAPYHGNGSMLSMPPPGTAAPNNHNRLKNSADAQQTTQALDFTVANPPEQSTVGSSAQAHNPQAPAHPGQAEPGAHDPQHFYQQVMKEAQPPAASGRATPLQHSAQVSRRPSVPSDPLPPGSSATQAQSHKAYLAGPLEGNSGQLAAPYGQAKAGNNKPTPTGQPSAASATPGLPPSSTTASTGPLPGPPPPHEQQHPTVPPEGSHNAFGPPPNSYYYYRHPYDAYSAYPPAYPPMDPRVSHLYYQEDVYGRYDPSYQMYDAAYRDPGNYRYAEPERPSSRASHTSDRPSSRQGYPEDYYNNRSGWNDYYAEFYDYADPNRSDRYPYDARYRDPRGYSQRYWNEQSAYQKRDPYLYENSHDRYEDHWRYDPRYASFDDDMEPRRDLYGDEFDRRSVHSEHSGHSLRSSHSRQSSFSSRSQQSQLYRSNHDLTATVYAEDHQQPSLRAEYPYTHFSSQQPYVDNYAPQAPWPPAEQVPPRPLTPEKFSVPHTCLRFGPGGFVIKVLPNLPSEGQPALVEIHSMEMLMQHFPEQEELRAFPGPLTKDDTHKVDVINFAQNKATRCSQNDSLIDKESARLLWDFIILLCRQNGTVVGTDIAELLLKDHKTVWLPGKSPDEANLIDFTNEALEQVEEESGEAQLSFLTDSLITTIDSLEKETERFRELLLYGRKKDALESAMKHGLWGHALLLASKMDSRTHARVMTRFANSLPINDPLQTVYQLMSGRMPAASTCCGDEKWGDWRPHLAMVLSNLTNNMELESRTMTTMGDTLASRGLLDAAHFCYLMAQVGFGVYTKKTSKLVLIGSNQSLPFSKFATNEAIQRTEAYEYAQSLGTRPCCLYNFQVFKFIYACRLAEMGLPAQAFHYCEVISKAILRNPSYSSPVLVSQLIQVSSQLRLFDPQIKEKPEQEFFIEPSWLVELRNLDGQIKEGALTFSLSRSTPQQYPCGTPSSELDQPGQNEGVGQDESSGFDNPLLASLLPNSAHSTQSVQLMPSAPQAILDNSHPMAPSLYQDSAGPAPFCPVPPPPAMGLCPGFSSPYGAEQMPMYPPMGLPPTGPLPQPNELQPQESLSQETGQGNAQDPPGWKGPPEPQEEDFYGKMASMGPGRRSRTTSQSSAHMALGRRSRTTSESSTHSVGRERQDLAAKQPSPPPPSIPEGKEAKKEPKKEPVPRKSGATWLGWLMGKAKNEAHLPDDKNKSIVWDEKKQRWVNLDEPEEENKPPPPPPTGFPQVPQTLPPGPGGPPNSSVNMFSRRAGGNRARYVDILNPSGAKPSGPAPAPSDLFAPLAPMPIPANLLVPNPALEEQQPLEGKGAEEPGNRPNAEMTADLPYLNSATFPPGPELPASNPEGSHLGELSRSSSMSSLSHEVSQHFKQISSEGTPAGTVQFYNPAQFAQSVAVPSTTKLSRIGQRKYSTLK